MEMCYNIIVKSFQLSNAAGPRRVRRFFFCRGSQRGPCVRPFRPDRREWVFLYAFLVALKIVSTGIRIFIRISTTTHNQAPALRCFH